MNIKYKILWLLSVYTVLLLIQVDDTEAKKKRRRRLPKDSYECEWQTCQRKTTKKCHKIRHCVKKGLQSSDEKGFDWLRDQNDKTNQVAPVTPLSSETVHQLKKRQLQSICTRIVHDKHKHLRFSKKCWQGRNGQAKGRKENTTPNGMKLNENAKSIVNYAISTRPSASTIPKLYVGGKNKKGKYEQADLPLINGNGVMKSNEAVESTISTGSSIVTQSNLYDVNRDGTNLEEREEPDQDNTHHYLIVAMTVCVITVTVVVIVSISYFVGYRRNCRTKQSSIKAGKTEISIQNANICRSIEVEDILPIHHTLEDCCNSSQYYKGKDVSVPLRPLPPLRPLQEHYNRTENEFKLGHSYQNNLLVNEVKNSNNDHTQTELIFKNQLCNTVDSSPTESNRNRPVSSSSSVESYICLPNELPPIDFCKSVSIKDVNITELLQRDEGTQTKHTNQATTIFNTQFQGSASFNQQGGELQLPGSSVRLVVPPETVKESESIHILGHVHSDLRQLKNGLQLEENENIYSPAPEYHMDANWKMVIKKHMVINIPHALQPGFHKSQLKVYRFSATDGTIAKSAIPEKLKENEELAESYYEIETSVVRIFTLHFSGFVVCYNCGKEILCPRLLNVDILGSNQIINGRREVRIQYLVWDMKGNIPDLRNSWITVNKSQFHQLERKSVTLELYEDIEKVILTFILTMTGEEANQWQTLTTENGDMEPFPLKTEVPLKKLMVCCREVPYIIEWVMISKPDHPPREQFQGIITMSDTIGHPEEASTNRYPASYIQNVPQDLPERRMDVVDILKRQLDDEQVEELCSKYCFPPETLAQLKTDKREMTAIDFKEKWIERIYRRNDFQRDLESHLTSVKAWPVLSTLDELEYFNKHAPPLYKFDSSGPEAMAEPSGLYLRCSSPVENSDHEEYELGCCADEDETHVKVLETEV